MSAIPQRRKSPQDRHYLSAMFEPASVAIVGASEKPGRVGEVLVSNMLAAGFQGRLYAVNPAYTEVHGVPCFAAVSKLPAPVDLAVIATPPRTIPAIIADCGRSGVRAVVVITAGFAEIGAAGLALQRDMLVQARQYGVRIVGPNCLGLLRPDIGLNASFARGSARAGNIALVSQSGAVCTALLDWAAQNGTGFSSVVSLGGSVDVGFGEILDYLAADERTRYILLYIEGIRDARRFLGSLRAAARAKPVVLMKVGRHPVGSRAAVSHTGAIVGGDDVFAAALQRTAAVRVDTLGQFIAVAQALSAGASPRGDRLAVITNGGGPGVMAADRAADLGMNLAELSPATIAVLQQALPGHWSHGNPVDLIGDADSGRYRAAVSACLADEGVDGVLVMLTPQAMTDADDAARAVIATAGGSNKPLMACWMGEKSVASARILLRDAGIPVFRTPESAVETFAQLAAIPARRRVLQHLPGPLMSVPAADLDSSRAIVAAARRDGRTLLDAQETKALLKAFHIPVVEAKTAGTEAQAVQAAAALGYPVAMKIRAANITHKSDVGGVMLGLADEQAVRRAYSAMLAAVLRARPDAQIEGVSVERMVSAGSGRELLIGVMRDPVFGPAITFGAGGTAVEVLRDRSISLPPLDAHMAADMIAATRIAKLLGPFRGAAAADRQAIAAVLLRVSELACELPELMELDINPLLADARGAVALDARVVLADAAQEHRPEDRSARGVEQGSAYAHLAVRPYPRDLMQTAQLNDGTVVTLRPIRPEDATMEREFVACLSERSLHFRFMHVIRDLSPEMLAQFTRIDYDREMAIVALHEAAGQTREIGVARYVICPDGESCEFALVVADAWQGKGLGTRLLTVLAAAARRHGLKQVLGEVLPDNIGMLTLCRNFGFEISPWTSGTRLVSMKL
jgi:acetyltransferase